MTTFQFETKPGEGDARQARRRVLDELCERLLHAEAVLHSLHCAKAESEERLASDNRADALKAVTGRSALETAIDSTRRLIDRLRTAINEAQAALSSSACLDAQVPVRLPAVAFAG